MKYPQYAKYLSDSNQFLQEWGEFVSPGCSSLIVAADLDEAGIAFLRNVIEFAGSIRSDLVVFCHMRDRKSVQPEDISTFARVLSELGQYAKDQGTRLSLHHHYGQPVMYREDIERFFNSTRADVGLTVDTAHLVKSGIEDVSSIIRDFSQVIDNFHLKDFSNGEFRVLGEGKIDFHRIFQTIKSIGYDGWVSVDEESGADLQLGMKQCLEFIRSGLEL